MAALPPAARKVLRFWEIPFLAVLGGFMLWIRMMPYKALLAGERAYYIGTDPYYHWRETLGIVRVFPRVPRFDPWTFYPNGTPTGQFGSLYDWGVAAWVVLTEGRDASETYVGQVLGASPAVLGALLIVPFYFLAKRLLGTAGAIVAAITLALLPGEFLIRSLAGYADHHVAEALMALVSILGVYVAVERGHRVRDTLATDWRNPRGYASALGFGVLGGVALVLNYLVWPPALLFLAILGLWLTIVILLEDGQGGNALGFAFGGAVSFAVAGLLMIPFVETTWLGEFNTYGILHVVASLAAAAWVLLVHFTSRATRDRGLSPWVVPGVIAALALVGFLVVKSMESVYGSLLWGLSWVTGIGVQRTTLTIAEARKADFFCSSDTFQASCLSTDFGAVAPVSFFLLIALIGFALWKRRRADILLAIWSLVVFRATDTQIRFSYYLALNMALLIGWLAARVAEGTGMGKEREASAAPAKGTRGRRTRQAVATADRSRPLQVAAVAAVLLIVLPGNVFASDTSMPAWESAGRISGPDSDLVVWTQGLEWMRGNTPTAGVDLGLVTPRPGPEGYDYPDETYGVLSWWDYGHWIETLARRPPVANPFQQAAPFASTWFTEREPARAEELLEDWTKDAGPVRYVWIDDAMATGKYGAITVWANSQNASRAQWADGEYSVEQSYRTDEGRSVNLPAIGPEYTESMMGRLYDQDANGLSHYRLVYEHPDYRVLGSVINDGGRVRCFHDLLASRACPIGITNEQIQRYQSGTVMRLGDNANAYDLTVASRLKLFERVEGARLVGEAAPGETVQAQVQLSVQQPELGSARTFVHTVQTTADDAGRFELVFPYATTDVLPPDEGGTNTLVQARSAVLVTAGERNDVVDVPDRSVLQGLEVPVDWQS